MGLVRHAHMRLLDLMLVFDRADHTVWRRGGRKLYVRPGMVNFRWRRRLNGTVAQKNNPMPHKYANMPAKSSIGERFGS
jgi:hypothetical protein